MFLQPDLTQRSQYMQKVDVPVLSDQMCNTSYLGIQTDAMLCAGTETQGGCNLDDGGPTVLVGTDEVVAIYMFDRECPTDGNTGGGLYIEVAYYVEWINCVMASPANWESCPT